MIDTTPTTPLWLRVLQFPPVKLLVLGGMLFYCIGFSNLFMSENKGATMPATIAAVAMIALAMVIYFGFARWIERREVSELSLPGMAKEMGIGILVGAGLYTACMLILMVMGIYRMDGLNPASFLIPAIASALSSGFLEELLFRGALFRIVEEWLGSWISIIISSAVFGLVHLANPDATLIGAIFISVEAGVLLAAAYMVTRRLWMSIGFHVSWNYTQSAVFGGIVSGGIAEPGLIKPILEGPDLLTGGQFGLEASLTAFLLCTTTGVILLVMAVRKGNIVQPFWKRSK
jgi:uncharacterized protein